MENTILDLPIIVKLKPEDLERVAKGHSTPAEPVRKFAQFFFDQYLGGGLMLKSTDVQQIQEAMQGKLTGAADIVAAVQAHAGRTEGQFDFTVSLDPAFHVFVDELSQVQGVTIHGLLNDAFNTMMQNGWLYSFNPTGGTVAITEETMKPLRAILGKDHFTAEDILVALQNLAAPAAGDPAKTEKKGK